MTTLSTLIVNTPDFIEFDLPENQAEENRMCDICQEPMTQRERTLGKLVRVECGHVFHTQCMKGWMIRLDNERRIRDNRGENTESFHYTCPYCRHEFTEWGTLTLSTPTNFALRNAMAIRDIIDEKMSIPDSDYWFDGYRPHAQNHYFIFWEITPDQENISWKVCRPSKTTMGMIRIHNTEIPISLWKTIWFLDKETFQAMQTFVQTEYQTTRILD